MKTKRLTKAIVLGAVGCTLVACGAGAAVRKDHKDENIYTATIDGKTKKNLTWAQSYDAVIAKTKVTSGVERNAYLQQAEDILMSTGAICPIYYYTDIFMKSTEMEGFYSSPLGYKFFQRATVGGAKDYTICVGPKADSFDPALNSAVDGAVVISHAFEGLYRWKQPGTGFVASELEPGLASGYTKVAVGSEGHVKYTFTLREGLKFSDGSDLKASDFVNSWNRAASTLLAADYGYMFDCIVGYEESAAEDNEVVVPLSGVVANDDARTIEVEITSDLPYFLELTAFPTYAPVKMSLVEDEAWWMSAETYVGTGPLKASKIDNVTGGSLEFVPNEYYWDKSSVKVNKLTFALSDDDLSQLTNFNNGSWKFIDGVPNDQIEELKERPDYFVTGQLGTYYVIFNVNDQTLNDKIVKEVDLAKFRKALGLLIDREYICQAIGKAGQQPANTFVGKGITLLQEDGTYADWTEVSGPNRDGSGYYDVGITQEAYKKNCDEAVEAIKALGFTWDEKEEMFVDIPELTYLYNSGTGHQAIGEYLQGLYATYGINIKLEQQEWATFLQTRKEGNYTIARNGWLADYNDACSFLDMWTSGSGNNDAQFGRAYTPVETPEK